MTHKGRRLLTAVAVLFLLGGLLYGQTAREIIRRLEENEIFPASRMEASMEIRDRYGTRTNAFIGWNRGRDQALIEFTSGEERGQKILRTSGEIYLYFPEAEEVIRIQGAALRESVLGSDLSYQDIAGDKGILDSHRVRLLGREEAGGRPCFKLELEATSRDIPYPRRTIWVDQELYILRAGLFYALSGRLLKELRVQDTMRVGDRTIPSLMIMEDKLKGNSLTEFRIHTIDPDASVPAAKFSLEELSW